MSSPPAWHDPASLRRSYARAALDESDLATSWTEQFRRWLADAVRAGLREPNAVVLATSTPEGQPSARTVLLKAVDERGFVVFTNHGSRKGREAAANPRGSLVFPWVELERQVVAVGTLERTSEEETAAYFASRPRGSQLGAWASPQSEVVGSREALEERLAAADARFPEGTEVPVPPGWGGLRLRPETVEFWQGRPNRLHDRLQFRTTSDGVVVERLAP
jgi:pyridoxamine 5'-phosphate oxidase